MNNKELMRDQLMRRLKGKRFKNCGGKELHITNGGYDTPVGRVWLRDLVTFHLREILKHSYR